MTKSRPAVRITRIDECAGTDILTRAMFASSMEHMRPMIEAGYDEAVRERLRLLSEYMRKGWAIPEADFEHLCDWLDRIAGGEAPDKALGLLPRRGARPSVGRLNRLDRVAQAVWRIHCWGTSDDPRPHPLNDQADKDGAFTIAARARGVSESEARLAWEVFGESYAALARTMEQGPPRLSPLKRRGRAKGG